MVAGDYVLDTVRLDDRLCLTLVCPGCGYGPAHLDEDQSTGHCSVQCPECAFHETRDFWAIFASQRQRETG